MIKHFKRNSTIHLAFSLAVLVFAFANKQWIIDCVQQLPIVDYLAHPGFRISVTFLITDIVHQIIVIFYKPETPGKRDNFLSGIKHITRLLYTIYFLVLLLSILNISLEKAFTSLSLVAAAIGLITKDYISNFINGMYMTFARVVAIGEEIQVAGHKGKIQDITLSSVHLINDDDDLIYIPNNVVFSHDIVNYTRREVKKISIDFEADVLSVKDVKDLEKEIIDHIAPFHDSIKTETFNLKVISVNPEFIKFKFQYIMLNETDKALEKQIKRSTIREIVAILHKRKETAESLRHW